MPDSSLSVACNSMEGVIEEDKTWFSLALLCEKRARENHVLSSSITPFMLPKGRNLASLVYKPAAPADQYLFLSRLSGRSKPQGALLEFEATELLVLAPWSRTRVSPCAVGRVWRPASRCTTGAPVCTTSFPVQDTGAPVLGRLQLAFGSVCFIPSTESSTTTQPPFSRRRPKQPWRTAPGRITFSRLLEQTAVSTAPRRNLGATTGLSSRFYDSRVPAASRLPTNSRPLGPTKQTAVFTAPGQTAVFTASWTNSRSHG